jgi:hypothetical protein
VKSLFVCFYYIDHHVIVKIDCQEKHSFHPFASNETNSARTKIFQTIELVGEDSASYSHHPNSMILIIINNKYILFVLYEFIKKCNVNIVFIKIKLINTFKLVNC